MKGAEIHQIARNVYIYDPMLLSYYGIQLKLDKLRLCKSLETHLNLREKKSSSKVSPVLAPSVYKLKNAFRSLKLEKAYSNRISIDRLKDNNIYQWNQRSNSNLWSKQLLLNHQLLKTRLNDTVFGSKSSILANKTRIISLLVPKLYYRPSIFDMDQRKIIIDHVDIARLECPPVKPKIQYFNNLFI
jgi:hypothetical protein